MCRGLLQPWQKVIWLEDWVLAVANGQSAATYDGDGMGWVQRLQAGGHQVRESVGKDRLVDAAYAAANFPLPVITVDLGTATTFNVVDENRVFRGGVICPGLSTGLRALGERCAQLPQVRLSSPKAAIGVNTESCMLSGSVLGTAVLLDGITQRIEEELGRPATLVVTGGLAKYVTPLCRHPLTYDPELLLKGLALLYQMNAPQPHYAAGGRRRNPNNNFRRGRRPRSQRRERREEKNKNG